VLVGDKLFCVCMVNVIHLQCSRIERPIAPPGTKIGERRISPSPGKSRKNYFPKLIPIDLPLWHLFQRHRRILELLSKFYQRAEKPNVQTCQQLSLKNYSQIRKN
jgi:hypothetical protein